jgi:hypothetical protein
VLANKDFIFQASGICPMFMTLFCLCKVASWVGCALMASCSQGERLRPSENAERHDTSVMRQCAFLLPVAQEARLRADGVAMVLQFAPEVQRCNEGCGVEFGNRHFISHRLSGERWFADSSLLKDDRKGCRLSVPLLSVIPPQRCQGPNMV